jgi:hypothetical protein
MRTAALLALVVATLACGSDPAPAPDAAPCGGACGPGTVCSEGRCVVVEAEAGVDVLPLDGPGVDASTCSAGSDPCGTVGACFAFATSRDHCGGCQYACPAWSACVRGACAPSWNLADNCPAGEVDCDRAEATGCEVNIRSSPRNCGACGVACEAGSECRAGRCVAP